MEIDAARPWLTAELIDALHQYRAALENCNAHLDGDAADLLWDADAEQVDVARRRAGAALGRMLDDIRLPPPADGLDRGWIGI